MVWACLTLALASLCADIADAIPNLSFPIDAQLPPVAIALQNYTFTFAANTFAPSNSLTYRIYNAPYWLNLDSGTRTFYGTPTVFDVGKITLQLEADDSNGSSNDTVTLVVVDQKLLWADQTKFVDQLSRAGNFSAPSTLLIQPRQIFVIDLSSSIFDRSDSSTRYSAVSPDSTPLPAWAHFDAASITLFGTTPDLLTPQASPLVFDFALSASNLAGYREASLTFRLSIQYRILAFVQPIQVIQLKANSNLTIPSLLSGLRKDNTPIARSSLVTVSANQPTWLGFDSDDLSFHGSVPVDVTATSFRVAVVDDQNDIASLEVKLAAESDNLPNESTIYLGEADAKVGKPFSYTFVSSDLSHSADHLEIDLGALPWLSFFVGNLSLYGLVPNNTTSSRFNLNLSFETEGMIVQTQTLTISVQADRSDDSQSTESSSRISSRSTPTASTTGDALASRRILSRSLLATAIASPLAFFLLLSLTLVMCVRKRRRRQLEQARISDSTKHLDVPINDVDGAIGTMEDRDYANSTGEMEKRRINHRIEMNWPLSNHSSNTNPGDRLSTGDESIQTRSSWYDMLDTADAAARNQLWGSYTIQNNTSTCAEYNLQHDSISPSIPPRSIYRPLFAIRSRPSSMTRSTRSRSARYGSHADALLEVPHIRPTLRQILSSSLHENVTTTDISDSKESLDFTGASVHGVSGPQQSIPDSKDLPATSKLKSVPPSTKSKNSLWSHSNSLRFL